MNARNHSRLNPFGPSPPHRDKVVFGTRAHDQDLSLQSELHNKMERYLVVNRHGEMF